MTTATPHSSSRSEKTQNNALAKAKGTKMTKTTVKTIMKTEEGRLHHSKLRGKKQPQHKNGHLKVLGTCEQQQAMKMGLSSSENGYDTRNAQRVRPKMSVATRQKLIKLKMEQSLIANDYESEANKQISKPTAVCLHSSLAALKKTCVSRNCNRTTQQ